jgi:ATP-dependent DNA helicase RecQ
MLNFINLHPGQSGLIYVRSRRESELLSQALRLLKYETIAYHGGLGSQQRREIEQQWLRGELPFVVCTNAFGLGINKPDIRWILHYHPPALLSEYLQEIGRGGRDQLPANCLTLISEPTGWLDPSDLQRQGFFQQQLEQQYRQATAIARQIPRQGEIQAIKATFPDLELSLSLLHRLGQLEWLDPFHYRLLNDRHSPHFSPINAIAAQSVQPYLRTRRCRWQFLLQAFGWLSEAKNLACGQCDNCRRFKFKL